MNRKFDSNMSRLQMHSLRLVAALVHSKSLFVMALIIIDVCLVIIFGLSRSIDIPTFHLDGAYHTASALYRLADGQWPGKDFYPYIGVGVIYFIYPFFHLAGNDIAASVFAVHSIVLFSYFFVIVTIVAFLSDSQKFTTGIIVGTISLVLTLWLYPKLPRIVLEQFMPGNSLRPLRSFLPYIMAITIYLILRSRLKPVYAYSLVGSIAGLCLLWSNDFAIPTFVLSICFVFIWASRTSVLSLRLIASTILSAILSATVGLLLSTNNHVIEMITFNFLDVPFDQYWYFGPWSAESRILTFTDIFTKLLPDFGRWSATLLLLAVIVCFRPKLEYQLLFFIGLALASGGALATIGGHRYPGYQTAFIFWSQATALFAFILFVYRCSLLLGKRRFGTFRAGPYITALVLLVATTFFLRVFQDYASAKMDAEVDPNRFYVHELGGYLSTDWREYVIQARASKETSVLEEYWGLWSAITRRHASTFGDSVIHALGSKRTVFSSAVKALPDMVITTRHSTSPKFQSWSFSANYWFYQPLIENYRPAIASRTTLVWRKGRSSDLPEASCEINKNGKGFSIIASSPGYYEVKLTLNYAGSSRSLLMVKNGLNFTFGAGGYLSLNPRNDTHTFPVAAPRSGSNDFDFKIVSSSKNQGDSYLSISKCTARQIVTNHFEDFLP